MIKRFHVHIYKVIEKMETDVWAYNKTDAKARALEIAHQGILKSKPSDCALLALEFDKTKGKNEDYKKRS